MSTKKVKNISYRFVTCSQNSGIDAYCAENTLIVIKKAFLMTRYARLVSEVFPIVTENYPIVLAILDLIIILVMSHFTLLMEHLIYNFINGLSSLCRDQR